MVLKKTDYLALEMACIAAYVPGYRPGNSNILADPLRRLYEISARA